jgi:hypothetical protein
MANLLRRSYAYRENKGCGNVDFRRTLITDELVNWYGVRNPNNTEYQVLGFVTLPQPYIYTADRRGFEQCINAG